MVLMAAILETKVDALKLYLNIFIYFLLFYYGFVVS